MPKKNKTENKSVELKEYTDEASGVKNVTVRVTYDPVFNVFYLQAQEVGDAPVPAEFVVDSKNNPNMEDGVTPEDEAAVLYGAGVRRCKVDSTPNIDLFKILARLNARPEEVTGDEIEQTADVAVPTEDIMDNISPEIEEFIAKLNADKQDMVDNKREHNYDYDVQRNDTLIKMVKSILDSGEGIILVTGHDWSNAAFPHFKESIASDFLNSDMDVDTLLKECCCMGKKKDEDEEEEEE